MMIENKKIWKTVLELENIPLYITDKDLHNRNTNYTFFKSGFYYIVITHVPRPLTKGFMLLHELGHVWFHENILHTHMNKRDSKYDDIDHYTNPIEDLFVDYHLCKKFEDYYFILVRFICERVLSQNPKLDCLLPQYLHSYVLFSQYFAFILKDLHRTLFKPYITKTIQDLGKHIKHLKYSIHDLNQALISFNDIRDSIDRESYLDYAYRVLQSLGFWNGKHITEYLDIAYNSR